MGEKQGGQGCSCQNSSVQIVGRVMAEGTPGCLVNGGAAEGAGDSMAEKGACAVRAACWGFKVGVGRWGARWEREACDAACSAILRVACVALNSPFQGLYGHLSGSHRDNSCVALGWGCEPGNAHLTMTGLKLDP